MANKRKKTITLVTFWDKVYEQQGVIVGTRPLPDGMLMVYADDKYVLLRTTCVKTVQVA